tara:strand:+ start:2056 stop:2430 length:375 start_codon:yes stop_codon:yes gene_type:complete
MVSLFSCNPDCSIEKLMAMDWVVVFGFFLFIYLVSTVWRKWAFSRNKYPQTSIKWHIPRFIYISTVFSLVSMPIVWWLFGYTGAKIFGLFILPESVFVLYILWTLSPDKDNKSLKSDAEKHALK